MLREEKWWYTFFAFGKDTACQNAWDLVQKNEKTKNYIFKISNTHCAVIFMKVQNTWEKTNNSG